MERVSGWLNSVIAINSRLIPWRATISTLYRELPRRQSAKVAVDMTKVERLRVEAEAS